MPLGISFSKFQSDNFEQASHALSVESAGDFPFTSGVIKVISRPSAAARSIDRNLAKLLRLAQA